MAAESECRERESPAHIGSAMPAEEPERYVKVKMPVRLHTQLQSLKVLRKRQISDSVTEALEKYFADLELAER